MSSIKTKVQFYTFNALEIVDIAYARPGTKVSIPRVRQVDDRATRLYFHKGKGDPEIKAAIHSRIKTLEGFAQVGLENTQLVQKQVQGLIDSDPLLSLADTRHSQKQNVEFVGKTPLAGAMLRTVMVYDRTLDNILQMRKSGFFIGNAAEEGNKLIKRAGMPVRQMMHHINENLVQLIKQLEPET